MDIDPKEGVPSDPAPASEPEPDPVTEPEIEREETERKSGRLL